MRVQKFWWNVRILGIQFHKAVCILHLPSWSFTALQQIEILILDFRPSFHHDRKTSEIPQHEMILWLKIHELYIMTDVQLKQLLSSMIVNMELKDIFPQSVHLTLYFRFGSEPYIIRNDEEIRKSGLWINTPNLMKHWDLIYLLSVSRLTVICIHLPESSWTPGFFRSRYLLFGQASPSSSHDWSFEISRFLILKIPKKCVKLCPTEMSRHCYKKAGLISRLFGTNVFAFRRISHFSDFK